MNYTVYKDKDNNILITCQNYTLDDGQKRDYIHGKISEVEPKQSGFVTTSDGKYIFTSNINAYTPNNDKTNKGRIASTVSLHDIIMNPEGHPNIAKKILFNGNNGSYDSITELRTRWGNRIEVAIPTVTNKDELCKAFRSILSLSKLRHDTDLFHNARKKIYLLKDVEDEYTSEQYQEIIDLFYEDNIYTQDRKYTRPILEGYLVTRTVNGEIRHMFTRNIYKYRKNQMIKLGSTHPMNYTVIGIHTSEGEAEIHAKRVRDTEGKIIKRDVSQIAASSCCTNKEITCTDESGEKRGALVIDIDDHKRVATLLIFATTNNKDSAQSQKVNNLFLTKIHEIDDTHKDTVRELISSINRANTTESIKLKAASIVLDKALTTHPKCIIDTQLFTLGEKFVQEYPSNYYCPISLGLMKEPVKDKYGHTYDLKNIKQWILNNKTSPLTRQPLRLDDLNPNHTIKTAIEREIKEQLKNSNTCTQQHLVLLDTNKSDVIDIKVHTIDSDTRYTRGDNISLSDKQYIVNMVCDELEDAKRQANDLIQQYNVRFKDGWIEFLNTTDFSEKQNLEPGETIDQTLNDVFNYFSLVLSNSEGIMTVLNHTRRTQDGCGYDLGKVDGYVGKYPFINRRIITQILMTNARDDVKNDACKRYISFAKSQLETTTANSNAASYRATRASSGAHSGAGAGAGSSPASGNGAGAPHTFLESCNNLNKIIIQQDKYKTLINFTNLIKTLNDKVSANDHRMVGIVTNCIKSSLLDLHEIKKFKVLKSGAAIANYIDIVLASADDFIQNFCAGSHSGAGAIHSSCQPKTTVFSTNRRQNDKIQKIINYFSKCEKITELTNSDKTVLSHARSLLSSQSTNSLDRQLKNNYIAALNNINREEYDNNFDNPTLDNAEKFAEHFRINGFERSFNESKMDPEGKLSTVCLSPTRT